MVLPRGGEGQVPAVCSAGVVEQTKYSRQQRLGKIGACRIPPKAVKSLASKFRTLPLTYKNNGNISCQLTAYLKARTGMKLLLELRTLRSCVHRYFKVWKLNI